MSAKERIEQTPQIGELEMQWLRGKPGELFPWVIKRSRYRVVGHGVPNETFRSRIHTHICTEGTPSIGDLFTILEDIKLGQIRCWHIASLGKTGKVEGYFSMRATRKMLEDVKNPTKEEKELFEKIAVLKWVGVPKNKKVQIKAELMEKFKELGLSVRSTPVEGYIFNGQRFVKK